MITSIEKYVIKTIEYPIEFLKESDNTKDKFDGDLTKYISEAILFESENIAKMNLETLDEPNLFHIVKLKINYEI
jgi:hypothetical protein